jgi:integrase
VARSFCSFFKLADLLIFHPEIVARNRVGGIGKTVGSSDYVALPFRLAQELETWRADSKYRDAEDFIFPNSLGGFILKDNYLNRVLYPVRDQLKLGKLNFQVLRRTFATRAYGERKGTLKDVQKHLRHAKASTSLENYIKEVPDSVSKMVDAMYELMAPEIKAVQ